MHTLPCEVSAPQARQALLQTIDTQETAFSVCDPFSCWLGQVHLPFQVTPPLTISDTLPRILHSRPHAFRFGVVLSLVPFFTSLAD